MRGRWEAAFWKDAVDFLQVRNLKGERRLYEGDRGGHGLETGRSARQDEEEDEEEEYYHIKHLLSF